MKIILDAADAVQAGTPYPHNYTHLFTSWETSADFSCSRLKQLEVSARVSLKEVVHVVSPYRPCKLAYYLAAEVKKKTRAFLILYQHNP